MLVKRLAASTHLSSTISEIYSYSDIGLSVASDWFLRASAMLKHVIDIGWTSVCLFVRLSVRPSVTRWYCIKTAEPVSYTHLTLPTIYSV